MARLGKTAASTADLASRVAALRPQVEAFITPERTRRYLARIADIAAPSGAASALRVPALRALLAEDGALSRPGLTLHGDFMDTGSAAFLTGKGGQDKPLWYFGHLDTVSYLVQPAGPDGAYPLVPFCYHLMEDGARPAAAIGFDTASARYVTRTGGEIHSREGVPTFHPAPDAPPLAPGDRVALSTTYREGENGNFFGHVDNAGGAVALALAAPILAEAGIEAMLALPDEEEGPPGTGSQVMGRGAARIVSQLPAPELAVIADVQQAGGDPHADTRGGVENSTRLGAGAVLAEFSSLARGAVTPPHLYALARDLAGTMRQAGVLVQESNNAYSSRSDDVSVLLRTPNILLLGFPGFNRHFDRGEPRANLFDVVHLARSLVYTALLREPWQALRRQLADAGA